MSPGIVAAILCHMTEVKAKRDVIYLNVCVSARFICENVGLFSEYFRLDKKSVLEGRDGTYPGRLAVFREDYICERYSGKRHV